MVVAKPKFIYYPDKGFYAQCRWAVNYFTPNTPPVYRGIMIGPYSTLDAAYNGLLIKGSHG